MDIWISVSYTFTSQVFFFWFFSTICECNTISLAVQSQLVASHSCCRVDTDSPFTVILETLCPFSWIRFSISCVHVCLSLWFPPSFWGCAFLLASWESIHKSEKFLDFVNLKGLQSFFPLINNIGINFKNGNSFPPRFWRHLFIYL